MRARRIRQWVVVRMLAHLRPDDSKYLSQFQIGTMVHCRHRGGLDWEGR